MSTFQYEQVENIPCRRIATVPDTFSIAILINRNLQSSTNEAMTYLIDTAKAIRRIEEAGLPHEQAEAIVETFADANEQVATKSDIDHLRSEMKAEIKRLEEKIASLEKYLLFRIVLTQLAGVGLVFALIKFFG